jgi:hypothetical protein
MIDEAVAAAKQSDVVVAVVGEAQGMAHEASRSPAAHRLADPLSPAPADGRSSAPAPGVYRWPYVVVAVVGEAQGMAHEASSRTDITLPQSQRNLIAARRRDGFVDHFLRRARVNLHRVLIQVEEIDNAFVVGRTANAT